MCNVLVIGTLINLINAFIDSARFDYYYCSGLAVKKMIDCGAGVVDADCKFT